MLNESQVDITYSNFARVLVKVIAHCQDTAPSHRLDPSPNQLSAPFPNMYVNSCRAFGP